MNMFCGMIDLNTVNNEDETTSSSGSPSLSAASGNLELTATSPSASSAVCMELWHACAGPLISLPKKGSGVVYFPQGHVEHLPEHPAVAYDLPPHVFCRVVDVRLHADPGSDEVYAQVSLVPDQQIDQKWREGISQGEAEDEDLDGVGKSMTPHMFCKTLTASDTSTHGGFSVPRRAAEDCFPPLDYKQQRPSQELVAKDLHGTEWKFRHIYRGQPRRHLLTTGWSAFVNRKKLVSGDAVLFLRGGDGELRLGIRRAAQVKTGATILPQNIQQFKASSLAAVVNALSMRTTFDIFVQKKLAFDIVQKKLDISKLARSSEIIVPYHKFSKSLTQPFSCGMRFKIRLETEDSSERRCSGVIVGVGDVDPTRWPGSKWKCLLVRWDDMEVNHINRVSPWEIEPSGSVSGPNGFVLPGTKRNRVGFPAAKPVLPVPGDGNKVSDFGEPLRFQKVLQGQEVFAFRQHPSDMRCYPALNGPGVRAGANSIMHLRPDAQNSSFQFHKVLQGQETVPRHGNNSWSIPNQARNANPHPPPSSMLFLQQSSHIPSQFTSLHYGNQNKLDREDLHGLRSTGGPEEYNRTTFSQRPISTQPFFRDNENFVSMCKNSCRLFGFPLTEGKVLSGKVENATSPSAYGRESNASPCNDQQLYQPPLMSKVIVSTL
ncbi:Arf GTPase arf3 [Orobanche minor]